MQLAVDAVGGLEGAHVVDVLLLGVEAASPTLDLLDFFADVLASDQLLPLLLGFLQLLALDVLRFTGCLAEALASSGGFLHFTLVFRSKQFSKETITYHLPSSEISHKRAY